MVHIRDIEIASLIYGTHTETDKTSSWPTVGACFLKDRIVILDLVWLSSKTNYVASLYQDYQSLTRHIQSYELSCMPMIQVYSIISPYHQPPDPPISHARLAAPRRKYLLCETNSKHIHLHCIYATCRMIIYFLDHDGATHWLISLCCCAHNRGSESRAPSPFPPIRLFHFFHSLFFLPGN